MTPADHAAITAAAHAKAARDIASGVPKLTPAEAAHLVPLLRASQKTGAGERVPAA